MKRSDVGVTQATRLNAVGRVLIAGGTVMGVSVVPCAMLWGGMSPFGPAKATVLMLAATMCWLGLCLDSTARDVLLGSLRGSRVAWALLATLVLAALSSLASLGALQSVLGGYPDYRGLLGILAYAGIYAAGLVVARDDEALAWIWRSIVVSALVVGCVAAAERLTATGLPSWRLLRVVSTLGNSSNLGVFAVLVLPILAALAILDRRAGWRVASWAAFGVTLLTLVWTNSRGAWLGALVGGLVAAFVLSRAGRWTFDRRKAAVLACALVLLAAGLASNRQAAPRAVSALISADKTSSWRLSTWTDAVQMGIDRPVLGWGANSFKYAYPAYMDAGQIDGSRGYQVVEAAHNLFLDALVSCGLPGLVSTLLVSVAVALAIGRSLGYPSRPMLPALAAALAGGLTALMFHYVTMDTGPLLLFLLACATEVETGRHRVTLTSPSPMVRRAFAALCWVPVAVAVAGVVLSLSAVRADSALASAVSMSRHDRPWSEVAAELDKAVAAAPWDPSFAHQAGGVAIGMLKRRFDAAVFTSGRGYLERADRLSPPDPTITFDRANLALAAAVSLHSESQAKEALEQFDQVVAESPGAGMGWAGRGAVLLLVEDYGAAQYSLERAVELSPRYRPAWRNLVPIYQRIGNPGLVRRAQTRGAGE